MLPARLDYLFTAELSDGTRIHQHAADRSVAHPLTKSSFWDVAQRLDQVRRFSLASVDYRHVHMVDLTSGHFKTDGEILTSPYGELTNYRLIYFRRCEQVWEGGVLSAPRIVGYFIGWQANDATGKNYQMTLEIPPLSVGARVKITK